MTKYQIKKEIMESINLFTITPNEILTKFSVKDFQDILNEQPYSLILSLRLKAMETYFNYVEAYEFNSIIISYINKHK